MRYIIVVLLVSACINSPCDNTISQDTFNYTINPTRTTPKGMRVDDSEHNISLELVDAIIDEAERCLLEAFPTNILSLDYWSPARCREPTVNLPIDRSSIILKIPKEYKLSEIDGQQLLMDEAPAESCTAKGLDGQRGCYWRCGIQNFCTIVTTPSLYMMKDPLIRIVTRCEGVWFNEKLAHCTSPRIPKHGVPEEEVDHYINLLNEY